MVTIQPGLGPGPRQRSETFGIRNIFSFLPVVFANLCEMGPLPHSEQILNVFIRFMFWNAYSKIKVKGGAEQLLHHSSFIIVNSFLVCYLLL